MVVTCSRFLKLFVTSFSSFSSFVLPVPHVEIKRLHSRSTFTVKAREAAREMGSIGVFVELTIIFALVCASALICIIQASSLRGTYHIYVHVMDLDPKFHRSLRGFEADSHLARAGDYLNDGSSSPGAEFGDSDLHADFVSDNQLLSFEDDDNAGHEGSISILCWLAVETTYARDSDQALLIWRALCYQELAQSDNSRTVECHFEASKDGELTVSFSDGEIAYRSNRNVSGVESMVLSEENDILLVDHDRKILWSSADNNVFNCID